MKYKKIMLLTIILACLLAVSAVSAAQNVTDDLVSADASADVVSVEETTDEVLVVNENGNTTTDIVNMKEIDEIINVEGKSNCNVNCVYSEEEKFVDNDIKISKSLNLEVISDVETKAPVLFDNSDNESVVTLKDMNGNVISYANISFYYYDRDDMDYNYLIKSVTLNTDENGSVEIPTKNVPVGIYIVKVIFWGDSQYKSSSMAIRLDITTFVAEDDNQIITEGNNSVGNFADLQTEINNVEEGGVLNLTKDYKYVNGSNNGVSISKSITINGNQHVVDGNHLSRIFQITASNVVLNNIFLVNGKQTDHGGAINWYGDNGRLSNSTFVDCVVCPVTKNSCSWGGAIFWNGKYGSIISCDFINNSAETKNEGQGGAIYMYSINGSIINCTFNHNTAYNGGGGAIYWNEWSNGLLINCTFNNNSAGYGGAIYIYYSDYLTILNSTFINNYAVDGGAVYIFYSDYVPISNCNFKNNFASEHGAAIIYCFSYNGVIQDCCFINNSVELYDDVVLWDVASGYMNNSFFSPDFGNIGLFSSDDVNIIKKYPILTTNNLTIIYGNSDIFSANLNIINQFNKSITFLLTKDDYSISIISYSNVEGFISFSDELSKLDVGTWNVTVIFEGNDNYYPCNATATITVLPVNSSVTVDDINASWDSETTFTANVLSNNTPVNEGTVSFYIGDEFIGDASVINGTAVLTHEAPSILGEHRITAIFNSNNYLSSNCTAKLLVDSGDVNISDNSSVGTFKELSKLIGNTPEGSTLKLTKDYIDFTGLNVGITITKSIVIDGQGHTIDAINNRFIFMIYNAPVKIININFANSNDCAVVFDGYNGSIINCSFINCSSEGWCAAISMGNNSYGVISDCIFINNSCKYISSTYYINARGAAILTEGYYCSINNCIFINNTVDAGNGGAIGLYYSTHINVTNCTFENNLGNAIYSESSSGNIIDCTFIGLGGYCILDDVNIIKRNSTIMLNDYNFTYGVPINIIALLKDSRNKTIFNKNIRFEFKKDDDYYVFYAFTDSKGIGELNIDNLPVGIWNVTVFCDEDLNYYSSKSSSNLIIASSNTSLTIVDVNATVGHEVALIANVNSTLNVNEGIVTFFDGENSIGESNVVDGVATLTYTPSTAGEHIITAIFNSTNYLSSNSTAKLLVDSATIEVLADQGIVGFNSTFVAEVKGLYSTINEGTVTFYINDEYLGSVPVENGTASISYIPSNANTYTVKVVFGDSDKFLSDEDSAFYVVAQADSEVIINYMNGTVGHDIIITATISSSNNLTINEGYVVFLDGETQIGESNVYNGVATLSYTPTTDGEHNITAIFDSSNYLSSNKTAKLLVDSATIEVLVDNGTVGFNSTFVAEVKGLYSTINKGSVSFYINDEYLGAVPVVNGSASISYVPLYNNNYTVKAVFGDSDKFLSDEDSAFYVVVASDTVIGIDDMNATVGHELIISVNVSSSNNLTVNEGYVLFFDGSSQIGESDVYNGIATLSYTPTTAGEHAITAMYYGTNYEDNINSALLNVSKAEVDLSINNIAAVYFSNPSNFIVNVISNSHFVNEGNVKYYVNNRLIGSSHVYGGKSIYSYVANATGSFDLEVVFEESDNYLAKNVSATFGVDQMPTTLTGESVIFDEQQYKTFTTELKDTNANGVYNQTVRIELIKYSGESAKFEGISDANGITLYDVGTLAGGMWYVAGTYNGNENYIGSSFADKFIVVRLDTTTEIEEISNAQVNHNYKLKANIHDENGKLVKEGILQFYLDGVDIGFIDLSQNQGHQSASDNGLLGAANPIFEYALGDGDASDLYINYVPKKAGTHTLTAVYEGTTIYRASNQTTTFVVKEGAIATTITPVSSKVNTVYGGKYAIATLKYNGGVMAGVKVTVKLNGKTATVTTDKSGKIKVTMTGLVPLKTYKATVTYAGNAKYAKSTKSVNVYVKKATPKITAKAKTFKSSDKTKKYAVKLNVNQKVKVAIKVNKRTYTAYTTTKGVATFKLNKLTQKGKHTATVSFVGNKFYNKAKSVNFKITVK